jgi:hypothetical protein
MQYAERRRPEYRARLTAKVAWLADLLDQWDAWDAQQHLPVALQRGGRPPVPGREALSVLHRAAMAELHDLNGRVTAVGGNGWA